MLGMETRASKKKSSRRDAHAANAGEAIPRLLNDIVVTHVLRSEHFDDPADLARLPAVSRAMRDAVAATGLEYEELCEKEASKLGCLSALKRLHRGGRLSRRERLCEAAARSGQLEELKLLRENGCPWDGMTCSAAARGGHLEVVQWARANSCPWDTDTCSAAALGGHLEVLQWARANGAPWDEERGRRRRSAGTSRCFSGRARTGHRGTLARVIRRHSAVTSSCCSGRARTAARGAQKRAGGRPWADISR